ncbi:MAG: prepilin-type N-terminal cleavage/methylation domain-containing protein [Planctomycetota bacterium]
MRVGRSKGFTLIELMIVVAIIALIAAFAIPALLRARMTANETGAVAALRSLVSNEATWQSVAVVDQDEDGTGEFGLFMELSGSQNAPGQPRPPLSGNPPPAPRKPGEFMAQIFGIVDANGNASKSGYLFVIYLPNQAEGASWQPGDAAINDPPADAGTPSQDAIDDQEVFWIAYAWPVVRNRSGTRVFCVSVDGTIYAMKNDDNAADTYSGSGDGPAADAALLNGATEIEFPDADAGETGNDGNTWIPLSN